MAGTLTTMKHFHIFLNPQSGQKKARQVWSKLQVLLSENCWQYTLTEISSLSSVKSVIEALDFTKIDGIIILGGDGTVYHLVNDLMNRPDWETVIKIPLGIIPTGTNNGLAKTLLELSGKPNQIEAAMDLIFQGHSHPLDLVKIKQSGRVYYSILSISWGLISDVDIESETLRFLGKIRTDIYAILRILNLRKYPGHFSFLPINSQQWQTFTDQFILIWAMNVPWVDGTMKAAPGINIDDGAMQVLIVREGISRRQLISAFLKLATGEHLCCPQIESYQVQQFRLEPLSQNGIIAVDGEPVQYAPIEVEILPQIGRVFGHK